MSEKSKIKRVPKRAVYDRSEIYKVLDNNLTCHMAFIHNGVPVSIPTTYGRIGDVLYVHGALASRMLKEMEKGIDVSISIAKVTGYIFARSAFHHSVNYESVVIFGKGKLVEGDEKMKALKAITDNMLQGRWEEVRIPSEKELNATKVIAVPMDEVTGKIRDEGVNDKKSDMETKVWAGLVPIKEVYEKPILASGLDESIPLSKSVEELYKK